MAATGPVRPRPMLGAIAGDVVGSVYEWHPTKSPDFPLFSPGSRVTDDGVLTCAVADAILRGREAERSAAVSHSHPEGIKGAQAVALGVLLARTGADDNTIRRALASRFGYDLTRTVDEIRPGYRFDVTCQGSVPEAVTCFLEADGWERAVRLAVSLGGDADTQACVAGALAEARWGVPEAVAAEVLGRLPAELRGVVGAFRAQHVA